MTPGSRVSALDPGVRETGSPGSRGRTPGSRVPVIPDPWIQGRHPGSRGRRPDRVPWIYPITLRMAGQASLSGLAGSWRCWPASPCRPARPAPLSAAGRGCLSPTPLRALRGAARRDRTASSVQDPRTVYPGYLRSVVPWVPWVPRVLHYQVPWVHLPQWLYDRRGSVPRPSAAGPAAPRIRALLVVGRAYQPGLLLIGCGCVAALCCTRLRRRRKRRRLR